MNINFIKMHGGGNDYIYIDCMEKEINFNIEDVAKKLSDRHFGVGGDGLVLICKSKKADAFMRMFNADGSEGMMCGNAIRCVAKYIYDEKIVNRNEMKIETKSGIKSLKLYKENDKTFVTVNMGKFNFKTNSMPLKTEQEEILNYAVLLNDEKYIINCVSMGNPHCVIFLDEVKDLDVNRLGEEIEKAAIFKEEFNIEFVKLISKNEVDVRVYERGSKETLACGTGACGVVAVMVKNGLANEGEEVLVNLLGGRLKICCKGEEMIMTGEAEKVFTGSITI